jgi:1-acyl-sn-glycerol-3-phosphate acyltransferase
MNTLRDRLGYALRVIGSGLCFGSLGLSALFVSVVVFPLIRLTSPDEETTRRRVRQCLHTSYRFFIGMGSVLGVISYEMHGCERLAAPGLLVVSNHPSLIDMLLLGTRMPQANCIVKDALLRNPFLRTIVRWADYIPNSAPDHLIENCRATLRAGDTLLVFPEGTRSVPGESLTLKRGAAHIALACGCDLLPVTILCQPSALTKTDVWYRVPRHRPHWRVSVGEPIRLANLVEPGESRSRSARRITAHLADYFNARIGLAASRPIASPAPDVGAAAFRSTAT